jgi:hypothetical protein
LRRGCHMAAAFPNLNLSIRLRLDAGQTE